MVGIGGVGGDSYNEIKIFKQSLSTKVGGVDKVDELIRHVMKDITSTPVSKALNQRLFHVLSGVLRDSGKLSGADQRLVEAAILNKFNEIAQTFSQIQGVASSPRDVSTPNVTPHNSPREVTPDPGKEIVSSKEVSYSKFKQLLDEKYGKEFVDSYLAWAIKHDTRWNVSDSFMMNHDWQVSFDGLMHQEYIRRLGK